jgi:hypothetical protein
MAFGPGLDDLVFPQRVIWMVHIEQGYVRGISAWPSLRPGRPDGTPGEYGRWPISFPGSVFRKYRRRFPGTVRAASPLPSRAGRGDRARPHRDGPGY